jgi:DNA-binding response OmpR family regulator
MTLHRARILVADDQRDVAVTLTASLRQAGATLTFTTSGEEALARIEAGGLDLLLLDMKMPPGDWGGLWVLTQMRERRLRLPVMVLSGEGGQRQTIEAMRLGARDWVDKGAAADELVERCNDLLTEARNTAAAAAAQTLPAPVAHAFDRYAAAATHDRAVADGLRAIEEVLRFAALTALADRRHTERGVPGVQATQFARPSLGVWLTVARALTAEGDPDRPAATWLAALVPDAASLRTVEQLVRLRNDIAHAGAEPTAEQTGLLRDCLTDTAHRLASTWQWQLHVVASLEYNGTNFEVLTHRHHGASPTPSTFAHTAPMRTGDVVLVGPGDSVVQLDPWLVVVKAGGGDAIGMYDTTNLPKGTRGEAGSDPPLQYIDALSRQRGLTAGEDGPTFAHVRHHFTRT